MTPQPPPADAPDAGTPTPTRSTDALPDARLALLQDWLRPQAAARGLRIDTLRPASSDASFRRYFRLDTGNAQHPTLIVMDAPPPMEDCAPFVKAASELADAGMNVPRVLDADLSRGFLLLTDLGTRQYLDALESGGALAADALYRDASTALIRLQLASRAGVFPEYDREVLLREMMLYPDWYVARHKGIDLNTKEHATLLGAFDALIANNLAQPRVFVHRDYHSRNLMVMDGEANPGVLDFQDALHGPITYDLVSLLRDAYLTWPEDIGLDWTIRHWERARAAGLPVPGDFADFYRDFEWMGLQRHLKVLGIFARLYHRDGKDRYLADLPRVLEYAFRTASRYNALAPLARLIERVENVTVKHGYTF